MFGSIAVGRTVSSYSHELQVACLTVGGYEQMALPNQAQCDAFLQSDTFAGMALVWQSYYTRSLIDGGYRAMVLNFQREHFCCGNALPVHCVNDSRPFPSTHPRPMPLPLSQQRRQCEARGSFAYPPTKECKTNLRCDYDLPYGACGQNPVTSASRGCGAFVFRKLTQEIAAIGTAALVFLAFPVRLCCFGAAGNQVLLLSEEAECVCRSCTRSPLCVSASSGGTKTSCPTSALSPKSKSTSMADPLLLHEGRGAFSPSILALWSSVSRLAAALTVDLVAWNRSASMAW
jgi:hypothetical protein